MTPERSGLGQRPIPHRKVPSNTRGLGIQGAPSCRLLTPRKCVKLVHFASIEFKGTSFTHFLGVNNRHDGAPCIPNPRVLEGTFLCGIGRWPSPDRSGVIRSFNTGFYSI